MEVEEEMPKLSGLHNSNGKVESANDKYQDEEEGEGMVQRGSSSGVGGTGSALGRLYNWPSSRIVRVSRASGGKDRHSKVLTSKGLRDRRIRLSVPTAIQFYDLQDRLGYDQPSKAVEWLLTVAATSIAELPSISTPFPDTPQQIIDGKRANEQRLDVAEVEIDAEDDENMMMEPQQDENVGKTLSKSACSSNSETSKGSGVSFSRSESRIKARERARERAAEREKGKENEGCLMGSHQNLDPISQNSSFTELLTGGIHNNSSNNSHNPNGNANESNFLEKPPREWPSTSMDYFATGLLTSSTARPMNSKNFLGQIHLGNPLQQQPLFTVAGDHHHHELPPHFSFTPDHLVPVVARGGGGGRSGNSSNNTNGDYNLNFSESSGFNRGTLQSNSSSSPSLLPHFQRFPTTIDGPPSAFFISAAMPPMAVTNNAAHVTPVENHYHQFLSRFDPQLQLCYDNTSRHHDHKGKGKD